MVHKGLQIIEYLKKDKINLSLANVHTIKPLDLEFMNKSLKKYILNDKKVSKGKLNLILINQKGVAFKTDKYNLNNLKKALN